MVLRCCGGTPAENKEAKRIQEVQNIQKLKSQYLSTTFSILYSNILDITSRLLFNPLLKSINDEPAVTLRHSHIAMT